MRTRMQGTMTMASTTAPAPCKAACQAACQVFDLQYLHVRLESHKGGLMLREHLSLRQQPSRSSFQAQRGGHDNLMAAAT